MDNAIPIERRREDRVEAKRIAARIRNVRLSLGLSDEAFADALLLEPKKLKIYEHGRYRFTARHVAIVARLAGCEVGAFFVSEASNV